MSRLSLLRTDDFTGGLNLRADPFQLASNESPDLLNVDIDPRGGFQMRGGMTKLNSSAIGGISNGSFSPKRLFAWDAATPQVLLSANNAVYYATTTAFTSMSVTTTAPFGASFAPWTSSNLSLVYIATGTTSYKWDGSTATALTASGTGQWQNTYSSPTGTHMPTSRFVSSHVDRLWCAYTTEDGVSYPNRVRFSHPINRESWADTDYIDIVDGGSGITHIVPFGGNLLVFKKRAVFAILGYSTDTFQVVPLTNDVGAVNPTAVAATERAVYFFSWPDGLFMYDGQSFVDLFPQIRPNIQNGTVNQLAQDAICVSSCNRKIWVSVPEGVSSVSTSTFVYDPTINQRGAWTKYQTSDSKGIGPACDFVGSTGTTNFLACHPSNAYVLKVDQSLVYQDDVGSGATNFSSYYVTGWIDAQNVASKKMWRRPDFVVKQPTVSTVLTMSVYHDWEEALVARSFQVTLAASENALIWTAVASEPDGVNGWNQASWGAPAVGSSLTKGKNLGLARSIQLKVAGPGGKPWGVNSVTYKYNSRKVRA